MMSREERMRKHVILTSEATSRWINANLMSTENKLASLAISSAELIKKETADLDKRKMLCEAMYAGMLNELGIATNLKPVNIEV